MHQLLDELITTRNVYLYPAFVRSGTYRTHVLSHKLIETSSQVSDANLHVLYSLHSILSCRLLSYQKIGKLVEMRPLG